MRSDTVGFGWAGNEGCKYFNDCCLDYHSYCVADGRAGSIGSGSGSSGNASWLTACPYVGFFESVGQGNGGSSLISSAIRLFKVHLFCHQSVAQELQGSCRDLGCGSNSRGCDGIADCNLCASKSLDGAMVQPFPLRVSRSSQFVYSHYMLLLRYFRY